MYTSLARNDREHALHRNGEDASFLKYKAVARWGQAILQGKRKMRRVRRVRRLETETRERVDWVAAS